jgi:DNA-binding transcriptional MocR family regulator
MSTPLYKQLSEQLAGQIRQGIYKTAEKLPSVRQLAKQQNVSVSTVIMSYNTLEDWGLIEVKPKSGYYVKVMTQKTLATPHIQQSTPPPNDVTTSQLVMDIMRDSSDPRYISLGAAIPANDFPIIGQLKKTFAQIVRTEKFLGIGYDSTKGCEQLRRQLAKRAVDSGIHISPEDIIITAGCQGAIGLCLRSLCKPGDIVAVETPGYYGLLQLIESLGLKAIEIPSDPVTGMSIEALKLALEQWPIKVILSVPSFSNPVGALMPDSNKKKLVDLIYEYDIPFIEMIFMVSWATAINDLKPSKHLIRAAKFYYVHQYQRY